MMKEDKLREKAMQFQMLQANIQSLQERENLLVQKIEELHRTRLALKELDVTKKGDTFIPIGSGNFIPGKITDLESVLVGNGGGIAINKQRTDAIDFVKERIDELEGDITNISKQGQNLLTQLSKLQTDIEKLQK